MHLFSQLHLETSLKRIWHEVFLGRQIIFYYMDGTETSSCLLQLALFDISISIVDCRYIDTF